jgi:hypothetical protein
MSSDPNPYASPAPVNDVISDRPPLLSTKHLGFRPAVYLTRGVSWLLRLQIGVCLLLMVALGVWYWDLGQHHAAGMDAHRVNQHSAVQMPLIIGESVLQIAATILFFFWLYRIQSNLIFLDNQNLEFTPGWAVGWFFIPIANLVKPYQVVREAWQASDPKTIGCEAATWSAVSSALLVGWWWAFHLAMAIGGNLLRIVEGNPETVEQYQQASLISIGFFTAIEIPYFAMQLRLVQRIHQMQVARHEHLLAALPRPDAAASPFA